MKEESESPIDISQEGASATISTSSASTGQREDEPKPVGMSADELAALAHAELLAMAVSAEVPDCRTMSRDELIDALSELSAARGK